MIGGPLNDEDGAHIYYVRLDINADGVFSPGLDPRLVRHFIDERPVVGEEQIHDAG